MNIEAAILPMAATLTPFAHWPCGVAALVSIEVSHWITQRRSLLLLGIGIVIGIVIEQAVMPVLNHFRRKNAVK